VSSAANVKAASRDFQCNDQTVELRLMHSIDRELLTALDDAIVPAPRVPQRFDITNFA